MVIGASRRSGSRRSGFAVQGLAHLLERSTKGVFANATVAREDLNTTAYEKMIAVPSSDRAESAEAQGFSGFPSPGRA